MVMIRTKILYGHLNLSGSTLIFILKRYIYSVVLIVHQTKILIFIPLASLLIIIIVSAPYMLKMDKTSRNSAPPVDSHDSACALT